MLLREYTARASAFHNIKILNMNTMKYFVKGGVEAGPYHSLTLAGTERKPLTSNNRHITLVQRQEVGTQGTAIYDPGV